MTILDNPALTEYNGGTMLYKGMTEMSLDDFFDLTQDEQNRYFELYQQWGEQHGIHTALDKNFLQWLEER